MTFLSDFRAITNSGEYPDHQENAKLLGATMVDFNIVATTRWGQLVRYVYQRDNEFVSVEYEEGSGDSDIEYDPQVFSVIPKRVTITKYVPVFTN